MGILGGQKFKSPGNVMDCPAQHFQKSKKFHQLQRKWFNFKPLTPTHPGEAVLGDTGRGGRRKVGVRKLERRKVEGGRREG